jgi:hypothetical protein
MRGFGVKLFIMRYFEINVSLNGNHYFATSERSITSRSKAREVVLDILKRFPKSDGYDVFVSYNECKGFGHYGTELTRTNFLHIIDSISKD